MRKRIYYKIPVSFSGLFEANRINFETCSEKESIDQHLELIIMTCPGEHRYDPEFGCKIWELDFEKVVSLSRWEGDFTHHIREAILKYEPRIQVNEIVINVSETKNIIEISKAVSIRKKIDVYIKATLVSTGKNCVFFYPLYLGPLSSD